MSEAIKFVLKGERDYVQGTSVFNALVDVASKSGFQSGTLSMSLKRMLVGTCCFVEQRAGEADDAVIAKFTGDDGTALSLVISDSHPEEDPVREPFDEDVACKGSTVRGESIFLKNPKHDDLIELVVSLCKKMHIQVVSSTKKWIFSRYEGKAPLARPESIEIQIRKKVGTKLTCSDVIFDGVKVADLFFS
jgi:heme/copper-type cytochrome/quinol oxidase subunit 2